MTKKNNNNKITREKKLKVNYKLFGCYTRFWCEISDARCVDKWIRVAYPCLQSVVTVRYYPAGVCGCCMETRPEDRWTMELLRPAPHHSAPVLTSQQQQQQQQQSTSDERLLLPWLTLRRQSNASVSTNSRQCWSTRPITDTVTDRHDLPGPVAWHAANADYGANAHENLCIGHFFKSCVNESVHGGKYELAAGLLLMITFLYVQKCSLEPRWSL